MRNATDEAAKRIKRGEPAGLVIHKISLEFHVNKSQLASVLGKRGAFAKKAKKNNPRQLSLF